MKKLEGTEISILFIMCANAFGMLGEGNFVMRASGYVMESTNVNNVK
jgi:hypothetical protein